MKLYYYKDPIGNFGDELNPWMWNRLLPGFLDEDDSTIFIGIGTLLNDLLPRTPFKVVFSAGVGYKGFPPPVDDSWKIYCVRGPLSAQKLGLNKNMAITDGAALLRTMAIPEVDKKHEVSFVPHLWSRRPKWGRFCRMLGINYIDPCSSVDEALHEIRSSKLVIAEAMHGAIVADAFRVPWIPVKFHEHILDFKWQDWCMSLGLDCKPVCLPDLLKCEYKSKYWIRFKYGLITLGLKWIAGNTKPFLSSDKAIESATSRLQERLEQLKKDYIS
ncbi:MAG: polysaccharide pyruvyl transferase family protein [Bacteroidota bacterium]|nr:polysaccharide pyruvyl transferase family protein [Bacteroidota bacterium]